MLFDQLTRRDSITLLGGAAGWPIAARAQQPVQMRRIGVLANLAENDPAGRSFSTAFLRGLEQSDWIEGRNVRIDYRFALATNVSAIPLRLMS
jgi:putative ABC transport system substrate-binding protein